eukprot:g3548.t1
MSTSFLGEISHYSCDYFTRQSTCLIVCLSVLLTRAAFEFDSCEESTLQQVMVDNLALNNINSALGDAEKDEKATGSPTHAVHIRVQQRNGRKSLTTVQGLDEKYDKRKILKGFKKEFCCNGTVVVDEQLGQILQLQGDQRKSVSQFLVDKNLAKKQDIKVHGF